MSVSVCQSNECIWVEEGLLQGVIEGMTCCVNVVGVFDRIWIIHGSNECSQIGNGAWIWLHFHCSLDSRVYLNDGFGGDVCSAQSVQCAVALWVKPDVMIVVLWVSSISLMVLLYCIKPLYGTVWYACCRCQKFGYNTVLYWPKLCVLYVSNHPRTDTTHKSWFQEPYHYFSGMLCLRHSWIQCVKTSGT